uniref:Uncharacterized protein n=1 Tax=Tanacetum cinerariifolium TaxID=118510 RepID=A0A699HW30_TANCI|nr:hypothetical protein [Tanacetum cinerariifolium]
MLSKKAFTRAPNQHVKYLNELWYTAKTLEGYKIWVSTPTGGIKREIGPTPLQMLLGLTTQMNFAKVIWEDIIHNLNKKTREKFVPYPRFISLLLKYMMPEYDHEDLTINPTQVFSVHNRALKPNQPEGPPFTDHMKAICNIDVPVESQALTTSSKIKMKVPQGKKPRARNGLRRKKSSKYTSKSKTEASKTGQLDKETYPGSAKDKSPSHPSASTPVVAEMHKEAQQVVGGPTSLGDTRCDALADFTAEADPKISAPNGSIPEQQGMDEGTQNYPLDNKLTGTNPSVLVDKTKSAGDGLKTSYTDLGSLASILEAKARATKKRLKSKLPSLKLSLYIQICLPTELKELPSKITELSGDVKELKKHVRDMEIELPGDLKEISKKLETFTSTISSLTSMENASLKATDKIIPSASQANASPTEGEKNINDADNANLKKGKKVMSSKDAEEEETESNFENDHTNPADSMVQSSKQKKLKKFSFVTEGGEQIHITIEKIEEQKRIEESLKAELAKQEVEKVKDELVDLMGIDVVTQYYNKKLMYDKYCDKMLKRRKSSKITKCDVLTKKGPITLKV